MLLDPAHLDSTATVAPLEVDATDALVAPDSESCGDSSDASRRIVGVRMRPDLQLHPDFFGQADQWGVKDPVTLEYFHLTDQEVAILRMLDARATVGEIQTRFEQRFAPSQLTDDDLRAFVAQLYRDGLVVVEASGQGNALFERRQLKRQRTRRQSWLNPLAIRLRGVDPHRFLDWLHDVTFWVFSPWCIALCLSLILSALTLAVVRFESLTAKLPTFHEFFTADNLLLMALVLGVVKTLHEIGHALSCRHFGGECHELGVLFLVFTPCLYCNVSDSWMLPSRRQRVAVSLAGMYVEMVLASVCTFLWWFSEPGLLNGVCLQVMFVCSVATLMFNGNPLLRYDAYYVLSDAAGIPNLASQARTEMWGRIGALWLGSNAHEPIDRPHRRFLLTYGIASTIYRWFVLAAILWFCHAVAKAHRLEILSHLLTIIVVMGVIAMPATQAVKAVIDATLKRRLRLRRFAIATSVLAAALFVLLTVPMPFSVSAAVVVAPADYDNVFVPIDGELISAVQPGTVVRAGDRLATLDNPKLKLEIQRLEAEVRERALYLKNLKARQLRDPRLESLVPTTEQQRDDSQRKLDQRRADLQ
ncbi:MAG: hemolysin D, partial [Planctomycetota bacterium]|nr:hemolysin D [Planctomycetota bacterium]